MGFTVYVLSKKKIAQIASQADCVILIGQMAVNNAD
jgi:hypothetical protein